jgi:hypothetical protein
LPDNYATALSLIDAAHTEDPRKKDGPDGPVPFELDYAQKMTRWLALRCPTASPVLQLACRAQHFRRFVNIAAAPHYLGLVTIIANSADSLCRWEIPRSSYPMTRPGYLTWRAKQKARAAEQVADLLASPEIVPPLSRDEIDRVAALIRKENLASDEETQALEDAACLVFLDDQFDEFEKKPEIDEEKVVGILRKTWAKMSDPGRKLALEMHMSDRAKELVQKALAG